MSAASLRRTLQTGPAFGAWLFVPSTIVAETVAAAGFDYVCIDCQHGFAGADSLWPLLQVLALSGTPALVRVPGHDAAFIGHALDAGAAGVIVPMVETAEQAAHLAGACRYPPAGSRSRGGGRAAMVGGPSAAEENAVVLCLPMIETAAGVRNAGAIATVEGIDGLYIGPNDLAVSLSVDPDDTLAEGPHLDAVRSIHAACRLSGRIAGIHAGGRAQEAAARVEAGFDMVTTTTDLSLLQAGSRSDLTGIRAAAMATSRGDRP